jgi:hypothetical protein
MFSIFENIRQRWDDDDENIINSKHNESKDSVLYDFVLHKFEETKEELTKYNALGKGLFRVRYASITSADCSAANPLSFWKTRHIRNVVNIMEVFS